MNYYYLGKLPQSTIDHFKKLIIEKSTTELYQWVMFDDVLKEEFKKIFSNQNLINKIKSNQKAFFSTPNTGMRIHKDGTEWNTALNIVISCNSTDWVRWYSDEEVSKLNAVVNTFSESRNLQYYGYTKVPYVEQYQNTIGDVYLVNTNVWHAFRCIGELDRIIIQTKFEGNPSIESLAEILDQSSFKILTKP
jgi:hypothetical protein